MRMFRRIRRTLAAVLLVACPVACSGWHTVSVSPRALLGEQHPDLIRVTTATNERIVVSSPEVSADTLKGATTRPGSEASPWIAQAESMWPVAIALADVTKVEVRQFSPTKTLIVVAAVPVTLAAIVAAICAAGDGCKPFGNGKTTIKIF